MAGSAQGEHNSWVAIASAGTTRRKLWKFTMAWQLVSNKILEGKMVPPSWYEFSFILRIPTSLRGKGYWGVLVTMPLSNSF